MSAHHVRTTFKLLQMPDFIARDLRPPIGLCKMSQLSEPHDQSINQSIVDLYSA